jgi:CHAT domain-containing protein/Tfp pilus assembly protein PilF
MTVGQRSHIAPGLWTIVLIVICQSSTVAQQQATPPPQSQPQSATSPDPSAQIDQLLKKANEEMNAQGQMKEAELTAKEAFDLSQKLGDKARTMQAMLYLGSAYYYEQRMPEALEAQQQAVALAREIGNRKGLSRALNNAAAVLRDLGRYEDSLNYFYQVLGLCRELHDLPMQWTALRNIGTLYTEMGDLDKGEAPLQESLRVARQLKTSDIVRNPAKMTQEASLESLGELEMKRGHYQTALSYYEQSRATNPENPLFVAELLSNMAAAHEKLGESQESVELLQQSIKMWEATGSGPNPVIVSDLGYSQESLGKFTEALATQEHALFVSRQSGANPEREWLFESRVAHVDRALGRKDEALKNYQNSIDELEHLRVSALNTESGRASILARSGTTYAETADLLFDLHREDQALEMAERGRARAFLDMLALSRGGLPDELTPEQVKREETLLARISAIQKQLWKEGSPAKEEQQQRADLTAAEDDLEAFYLEVRQANPRYASIRYPEPISVSRIQDDLLDEHTALVEFLLGEKRSLVWVVTKNKLTTGILPPRQEIEDQVTAYRKALTNRADTLTLRKSLSDVNQLGEKMYASLLQPVEAALTFSSKLIIVPDGALHYLPFETLILSPRHGTSSESHSTYLVEEFPTVYAPSASALATVREINEQATAPTKALLAFGDPIAPPSSARKADMDHATRTALPGPDTPVTDEYAERGFSFTRLPYTRDEVLGIGKLYSAVQRQIYLGEQAREETVKSEKLDQFRYIHFASHGFIDEIHPDRSGILFSSDSHSTEDGVLQMGEIMRLKLNADLVTLSACNTGLGKMVNGEGILGLTRAFFYAGARNVTVSLWSVNDFSTSALMKAFYENLNRGLSKSEALRQAKLTLLRGKDNAWHHPYYWGAFVLVGEGR